MYKYTINNLLQEEVKYPCLVIGIFLTAMDVHINRIPTNGFLKHDHLDSLKTNNLTMREMEKQILDELDFDYDKMNYALVNERVKNTIYFPYLNQPYYLLQIADFEVDVISHFRDQNEYFTQGERFSAIHLGSQVDLIIPFINPILEFESMVDDKIRFHVEAGVDELVKIHNGKDF